MAKLAIFPITLAIIVLLLIQRLSVKLVLSSGFRITIDYSFLTLIIKSGGKPRKKKKKKRFLGISLLMRFARRVIARSKITVNKLMIPRTVADPYRGAITFGGRGSGIYSIFNLIISLAESAEISENALSSDHDAAVEATFLDIVLQTRLYNIAFSGIILLYEQLKRRLTRPNVRKSN